MLQFAGQLAGPCELRLLRAARFFRRVLPCEGSEDTLPEVLTWFTWKWPHWKGRSLLETSIFRFYVKLWGCIRTKNHQQFGRMFWILWTSVGEEIQEWKIKNGACNPDQAYLIAVPHYFHRSILYWYSFMQTANSFFSFSSINFIVHLYAPSMHICHLSSSFNKFLVLFIRFHWYALIFSYLAASDFVVEWRGCSRPTLEEKRGNFWVKKTGPNGYLLHPWSLTWNLKMMLSKRNLLFQGLIFRFHVKLQGCIYTYIYIYV